MGHMETLTLFGDAKALPEQFSPKMAARTRHQHERLYAIWDYAEATDNDPRNELYYYLQNLRTIAETEHKKGHPHWEPVLKFDTALQRVFKALHPYYNSLQQNDEEAIGMREELRIAIELARRAFLPLRNTPNRFLARLVEPLYFMLFWDSQALYNACKVDNHAGGLRQTYANFGSKNYKYWQRELEWFPVWIHHLKVAKIGRILVQIEPLNAQARLQARLSPLLCEYQYSEANKLNKPPSKKTRFMGWQLPLTA